MEASQTSAGVEARSARELEKRGPTLLGAVGAILAGVVAIVVPAVASVAIELFVASLLVVAALFIAVDAMAKGGAARIAVRFVLACATFVVGIYMLLAPLEGTYTLTVMLVIWFVAVGVIQIMVGIVEWQVVSGRLVILSGAISLVLGVLIANRLPEAADWAIGLLVGLHFICYGTASLVGWWASRGVEEREGAARLSGG